VLARDETEPREATARTSFRTILIVVAIVAANLACKLPGLDRQSLWLDEALTVSAAGRSVAEILTYATYNQNPPLYALLMHGWLGLFGISETSARLFPVLCSTLTAVAVFFLARRFLGARAAIFAAILFTASNIHVQYAREARVYALASLLATLSAYAFLSLMARPHWRTAALLGVLNAALFYCHFVTVFLPLAELVATFASRAWRERAGRFVVAASVGSALLALPWMPYVLRNAPSAGEYWLAPPTWRDLRHVLKRFADKNRLLYLTLLLLVPAVRRVLGVAREAFDGSLARFLGLWGFLPIGLAFLIAARVPIFLDRYLLYASVGLALLFAYLLALVPLRTAGHVVLCAGLLALLGPRALREPVKDDWRALAAHVRQLHGGRAPGTSLVVIAANELPPFAYYFDRAAFAGAECEQALRAGGVIAVDDPGDLTPALLGGLDSVTVIRTRISDPDVSALTAAGFARPESRLKVPGLEVLASERVHRRE